MMHKFAARDIYIWGAGHCGVLTAFDLELKGIKIKAFIDTNATKIKTRLGLIVLTPEQILSTGNFYIIISIQNEEALFKIAEFLKNAGFKENKDYEYSELIPGTEIRKYFLQLNREKQPEDIKEIIGFFEQNPFSIFPYNFIHKYKRPAVFYDNDSNMKYILHNGKKLYMPSEWNEYRAANYYKQLCIEQDIDSPHRYETENYVVKNGDVIADIGSAEGIWALDNVEKASKIYLFECEEKWIKTLEKTFEPYQEKIEIVSSFVSNITGNGRITLDDFFYQKEVNFIKADIEGAELELLLGAKSILQNKNDLKFLLCAYHAENDEVILKYLLEEYGFATEYSKGYMLFIYDKKIKEPYVRRGLIRGQK